MTDLRSLPSVDALAARLDAPHAAAVAAARTVIAARREELVRGADGEADLVARAREAVRPSLRRVLNATGVVLHTGLGRAVLSEAAQAAVAEAAAGYVNLELDLETGRRGSRHAHVEDALCALTGAEAGFAVNNGAGAALLAAAALAQDLEVIVSRGELIEIGGGFRIPEVVAQAGATLVEVGTTNRTRLEDYRAAITERTGAILLVHQANFRQTGFVEGVTWRDATSLGVPVIEDLGSGALEPIGDEPVVRAGADLTTFSGDKLLGGPQAGIIVGKEAAVARARAHPLARALRIDKLSLAALAATLRDPAATPTTAMLAGDTRAKAERLAAGVGEVVPAVGRAGGGTLPTTDLPGWAVAVPAAWAAPLRTGDPPLLGRVEDGRLLLDPRCLSDGEVDIARRLVLACR